MSKREWQYYDEFTRKTNNPKWLQSIQKLILRGQKQRALNKLEKIVNTTLPLFPDDPVILHNRRLAWLYRIKLLRDWGRSAEALAWICLECEVNPDNVEAQALKKRMLKDLRLVLGSDESETAKQQYSQDSDNLYFDWEGVAGMRMLKTELERDVLYPFLEKDLYEKYKISLPNGILFHGPPGCGKTLIARTLANEIGFTFFDVAPSKLASIYVHGSQEKIGQLFEKAKESAPSIIFLDEIDALTPKRSGNSTGHHYKAEVNEFLSQLNNASEHRVLVIGATNYLDNIDEAILRPGRFDKKFYVGPPDLEACEEIFRLKLKDRPLGDIDYFSLAKLSEGFTPAEIDLIVTEAARSALSKRENIQMKHLIPEIEKREPKHIE